MQFTLDQYDGIIKYMNENYFHFIGGNSYLPPALKLNKDKLFQSMIFQYIDPVGDERLYHHLCKYLPKTIQTLFKINTVVIVDNFPFVNIVVEDKLIPIDDQGHRIHYAVEKNDKVLRAIEFSNKYPDKAYNINNK